MGIIEKERGVPVFDIDNLIFFFFFFFCLLLKMTARLGDKIGANLPVTEGLMLDATANEKAGHYRQHS